MTRSLRTFAALAAIGVVAIASACGSDSDDEAAAPTTAAPPATATTPPATTAPETEPVEEGDVAEGETVFAASCTGCHLNNGNDAGGAGPKLAAAGLDAERVRSQVENGGGAMPAGLVSGEDLDNVVAYVVSLQ